MSLKNKYSEVKTIMENRFGHDVLIAVATVCENKPYVRTVNSYYEDGSFYGITSACSNKMKHIEKNSAVSVAGDWFTAQGIGVNMGYLGAEQNKEIAEKLKCAFSAWYENGHINANDMNTCIFRIQLQDGVLFHHGTRYDVDFLKGEA